MRSLVPRVNVSAEIMFVMIVVNSALSSAVPSPGQKVGSRDTWASPAGPGAETQAVLCLVGSLTLAGLVWAVSLL